MLRLLKTFVSTVVLVAFCITAVHAQSGNITGTVTDAETGDPLPGVNVVIQGTQQGATTNADGRYRILNVSPGTYTLRASFVGYADAVVEGVDVNTDLTTTINFQLQEEAVGLDEVTVQASQPVVQPDVSANVANVSMEDVESVPITSVEGVIGLQAGIEGMTIRGTGASEASFQVDGITMNNPRNRNPMSGISFTAVEEVQVQTGGFNAEYGNVRSGLINVTMKEGPRDHYTADAIYQYSPASQKHFGQHPNAGLNGEIPSEEMGYWMRPYLGECAFVGTDSEECSWDHYTRRQYDRFQGFNSVSDQWQQNADLPDLTPEQLQELFRHYHRKDFSVGPEWLFDGSIGGPVPGISSALGDLRFYVSYRQDENKYAAPKLRAGATDHTVMGKVTSNITSGMKLQFNGMYQIHRGDVGGVSYRSENIFSRGEDSIEDTWTSQYGIKFTHTLGPNTYYEVIANRSSSKYQIGPGRTRSDETVKTIGPMEVNEAPFGVQNDFTITGPSGYTIGGWGWTTWRDSTDVQLYTMEADITSQLNQFSQLKAGFDLNYTDYNAYYGTWHKLAPSLPNPKYIWHRYTQQGAAYAQTKFEFEGLVANVGIRGDYYHPLGKWYDHSTFDADLASNNLSGIEQTDISPRFQVSPRLGISFPVTEDSKLYFNYGHFRNVQQPEQLFTVQEVFAGTGVEGIGNPNLPMQKTVQYELGFDQNLADQYLLRISGYYKAREDEPQDVNFTSIDGRVDYDKPFPLDYADIRGVEFTLSKNRGSWVRGFVNYTYHVVKHGQFGFSPISENPFRMRQLITEEMDNWASLYQPVPQPFAKFSLQFLPPAGWGPELFGQEPLNGVKVALLGRWEMGHAMTWTAGQNIPTVQNNLRWKDYWDLDARITKAFDLQLGEAQFFADFSNVLNLKRMSSWSGFLGSFDERYYMESLHLPEDLYPEDVSAPYTWVHGDDQPGDFRPEGVEFQPIEAFRELPSEGSSTRPLYYEHQSDDYYRWTGSSFEEADDQRVQEVLDNKAYIDNPNGPYAFLSPRDVFFGVRLTF
jgi:hypothetical protein